jgi:nucleoside 2-deoxyribosyltransferase
MRKYTTYLIGAMEHVADGGCGWRDKLTKKLEGLPLNIISPTSNEEAKIGMDVHQAKKTAYGWKRSGNWEDFDKMFDTIIKIDLECVRKSDFLILYINPEEKVGGTVSELTLAWQLKIPVYCYLDGRKSDMNSWVLRLITRYGQIFKTWDALIETVKEDCK